MKQQHFISWVSATNCLLDIKAKVSHRLRCNHVSPHCTFITQCCSASGARDAKLPLSNLLRVQHQGQLLGRTLAKNISPFSGDLWGPHRLPNKLESPDNTGLCEMNYISPSVTTSWLKAGEMCRALPEIRNIALLQMCLLETYCYCCLPA